MTVVIHDRWGSAPPEVFALWESLLKSGGQNPSLHPEWLGATLSAWGQIGSTGIAVVHSGNEAVAVIPFAVRRQTLLGMPLRCLELASNLFAYHAEIIASGNITRALGEFLAHRGLPRWDAFRALNIVAGGPTSQAIRALEGEALRGVSARPGEQSPYTLVDRDWTGYLATRNKKVRANVLRSARLMKDAGETGMVWYERGSDTRALLDAMLDIEVRSWKQDAGHAIVRGTPQCAYYERVLPWMAETGTLMANVLHIQDRPAAYTLCASWQGWVGQLKTSFIQELRDAGSRVIHASLERAFTNGTSREYDFLGDTAPHKTRWADNIRPHEDLWAFPRHLRGRLFGGMKAVADNWHRRRAERATPANATEQGE
jgi:CelD/BcsL family acetyltransferase involved in cellulose biosynthesis